MDKISDRLTLGLEKITFLESDTSGWLWENREPWCPGDGIWVLPKLNGPPISPPFGHPMSPPPGHPRGGVVGKIFFEKKVGLNRFRIVWNVQKSCFQNFDFFDDIFFLPSPSRVEPHVPWENMGGGGDQFLKWTLSVLSIYKTHIIICTMNLTIKPTDWRRKRIWASSEGNINILRVKCWKTVIVRNSIFTPFVVKIRFSGALFI